METGVCSEVNHTAFHSSVYMLAFDAVAEEHKQSTWSYIKSRIDPPFSSSSLPTAPPDAMRSGEHQLQWPPPPPVGEHVRTPSSFATPCLALLAHFANALLSGVAPREPARTPNRTACRAARWFPNSFSKHFTVAIRRITGKLL